MTAMVTDGPLAEYRRLCEQRLEHLVPVREPLVLISQIQRSGGTLVSQLFDGHPQCHAHPHELTIGYPKSRHWPPLDLAAPDSWFDMLYEKYTQKHFRLGYRKPAQRPGSDQIDVFPFLFLPRLQRVIFDRCITERPMECRRDVLDSYFTSYFNAWLDNQSLYDRPKKAVTAFAPRMHTKRASLEGLFADYPDGGSSRSFAIRRHGSPRCECKRRRTRTWTRRCVAGCSRPPRHSRPRPALRDG